MWKPSSKYFWIIMWKNMLSSTAPFKWPAKKWKEAVDKTPYLKVVGITSLDNEDGHMEVCHTNVRVPAPCRDTGIELWTGWTGRPPHTTTMGGCVSAVDQARKVRSEEIDKLIKDDSERFKRECKILLLGTPLSCLSFRFVNVRYHRLGRIREEHHSQANEDYSQRRVYWCRAGRLSTDCVQKRLGFRSGGHHIYEENRLGFRRVFKSRMFSFSNLSFEAHIIKASSG